MTTDLASFVHVNEAPISAMRHGAGQNQSEYFTYRIVSYSIVVVRMVLK
jgi:hypothetical protein